MENLIEKSNEITRKMKYIIEEFGEDCIVASASLLATQENILDKFILELCSYITDSKSGVIKSSEILRLLRNSLIETTDDVEEYLGKLLEKESEND